MSLAELPGIDHGSISVNSLEMTRLLETDHQLHFLQSLKATKFLRNCYAY